MAGHNYPRATQQIHFSTIVSSSPLDLFLKKLDTSSIKDGLALQTRIIKEVLCDNNNDVP